MINNYLNGLKYAKKNIVDYQEYVSEMELSQEQKPTSCIGLIKIDNLPKFYTETDLEEDF